MASPVTRGVVLPRAAVALLAGWVLALQPLLRLLEPPVPILGPLDWSAHVATAVLVLAALPVALARRAVLAALAASVLVDLDHVPGFLGWDALEAGLPRPVAHSLATVALALAVAGAAALRRQPGPRDVALGAAAGLAAHLARDLATGPGVALLWPLSDAAARISFWIEGLVLLALAAAAWRAAHDYGGRWKW